MPEEVYSNFRDTPKVSKGSRYLIFFESQSSNFLKFLPSFYAGRSHEKSESTARIAEDSALGYARLFSSIQRYLTCLLVGRQLSGHTKSFQRFEIFDSFRISILKILKFMPSISAGLSHEKSESMARIAEGSSLGYAPSC